MRLRIKGINSVTKRLADGRSVVYYYAWKGGPRLHGKPGSPEFIASYQEAVSAKVRPPPGTIYSLLGAYQESDEFRRLAARTKKDYIGKIKLIERAFGDFPLSGLSDRRSRGVFLEWRNRLPGASRRQADYAIVVLARIFSWSLEYGKIAANPLREPGRFYQGSRRDKVWSLDDEANFLAKTPATMHLPLLLALWTGQRQGDLLGLHWNAYDGKRIQLRQSKTGVRVTIPVGGPLKAALDAAMSVRHTTHATTILVNSDGRRWTSDGFRSSWRKACAKAGVEGLTFHDLRGTAVSRLALAGATEAEIAVFTGLTLSDVGKILDRHYLSRDAALAESAVAKLEKWSKGEHNLPTDRPTVLSAFGEKRRKAE